MDSFVEETILLLLRFRFESLLYLRDIDLELGLFTTNSVREFGDGWVGDGNSFRERIVPFLNRIICSRKIRTYSIMDVPELDWKHGFLSSGS